MKIRKNSRWVYFVETYSNISLENISSCEFVGGVISGVGFTLLIIFFGVVFGFSFINTIGGALLHWIYGGEWWWWTLKVHFGTLVVYWTGWFLVLVLGLAGMPDNISLLWKEPGIIRQAWWGFKNKICTKVEFIE